MPVNMFLLSLISFLFNFLCLLVLLLILCYFIIFHEDGNETHENDLSMPHTTVKMESDSNTYNFPEVYVDEHNLKPMMLAHSKRGNKKPPIYHDKVYEINGTIFREDLSEAEDNGMLTAFQIQTNGKIKLNIFESIDIQLKVSIQKTPYGFLINSKVLLTLEQWNTLVQYNVSDKCLVCDTVVGDTYDHVESDEHIRNLEKYQPLKEFDLSITRLIEDIYHCGVCNEIFDRDKNEEHFDSKSHEEKMLFATNRAFDVMFDFDIHDDYRNNGNGKKDIGNKNKDCYHFDRKRILSVSETSGLSSEGFYDYDFDAAHAEERSSSNDNANDEYSDVETNACNNKKKSYASIAKKSSGPPEYLYVTIFNKSTKIKFNHWHMIITFKSNEMYCMVCKSELQKAQKGQHCAEDEHLRKLKSFKFVDDYHNYFIRKTDSNNYHCGLCNNLCPISHISEHIRAKHEPKVSTALEVIPRINTNNDDSTREQRNPVVTDTEKEINGNPNLVMTSTNSNEPHNGNAHNITIDIVNKEQTYLKARDINNGSQTINKNNDDQTNTETINTNNDIKTAVNISNESYVDRTRNENNDTEYEINNESPSIYNDVLVKQYGFRVRVSFISYNLVCRRDNEYYCYICNRRAYDIDMTCHINEPCHIESFRRIPFQNNYGINLIRMVRLKNHCTICNIVFKLDETESHVLNINHVKLLNKALAFTNFKHCEWNPPVVDSNQRAMHPLTMDMNQWPNPQPMIQPIILLNQWPMPQPTRLMNPWTINQPTLGITQWPTLPPTRGNQPLLGLPRMNLNQPAINQFPIYTNQPAINMNQPTSSMAKSDRDEPKNDMNQPITLMNQSTISQPKMNMNQQTTSMPKLDIDEPENDTNQLKIVMNQPTISQPKMNMNQQTTSMPKLDIDKPENDTNQLKIVMNQPTISQPKMNMNQQTTSMPKLDIDEPEKDTNQLKIVMNQPTISQPKMNMNQQTTSMPKLDIDKPENDTNQLKIVMNQPTISQPKMNMNQQTTSMPKLDIDKPENDMNQQTTSMLQLNIDKPEKDMKQLKIVINEPTICQPKMNMNQHKNTPTLKIGQPKMDTNQGATSQTKNDKNQHSVIEPKKDLNPPKTDDGSNKIESIGDILDLDESLSDTDGDFEYFNEKFVYLKFKNTFIQVSLASYNSLVNTGDGARYCFVCSIPIYGSLKKHVESKKHEKCMDECKFLSKYDRHLLRQICLNYHCSICNVIFTRKDINQHIAWSLHIPDNKTDKKTRRTKVKAGSKLKNITFQNELLHPDETDAEVEVLLRIEIKANCQNGEEHIQKKNKIIVFGKNVLKISWDSYHGLLKHKSGHRCVLCASDVRGYELSGHINSECHRALLDQFEMQHLPQLIRKVNEDMLNCVICNVEVANKKHIVTDHLSGKRHKKNYEAILVDSTTVDRTTDCNEDVLNLHSN